MFLVRDVITCPVTCHSPEFKFEFELGGWDGMGLAQIHKKFHHPFLIHWQYPQHYFLILIPYHHLILKKPTTANGIPSPSSLKNPPPKAITFQSSSHLPDHHEGSLNSTHPLKALPTSWHSRSSTFGSPSRDQTSDLKIYSLALTGFRDDWWLRRSFFFKSLS